MPVPPMPALQDEALRKAFGLRVRELRQRKGWMQKQLSDKIGIPPTLLSKYEAGVHVPPVEKLVELADVLDTTTDFLLLGDRAEDLPIHNIRLLERFKVLQDLGSDDQEVVIKLIDAVIAKRQMESVLKPMDSKARRRVRSA